LVNFSANRRGVLFQAGCMGVPATEGARSEDKAVVGEADGVGELGLGFRVGEVVGHVDEEGAGRADVGGEADGLVDGEVGGVVAVAEAVEDEGAEAAEVRPGLVGDGGEVGAVGQGKGRRGGGEQGSGGSRRRDPLRRRCGDTSPFRNRGRVGGAHLVVPAAGGGVLGRRFCVLRSACCVLSG